MRASSGTSVVRTISRKRRFTRFLSTIFLWCLGTTTPSLGYGKGEADARASRRSVCIRFAVRLTASRSASAVSLDRRGKPSDLGAGVFRRQLDGKPFTSLLAAAAKNFASPFSSHPQPEAVSANPALVTGTIGGLAHYLTPGTRNNCCAVKAVKLFQH